MTCARVSVSYHVVVGVEVLWFFCGSPFVTCWLSLLGTSLRVVNQFGQSNNKSTRLTQLLHGIRLKKLG